MTDTLLDAPARVSQHALRHRAGGTDSRSGAPMRDRLTIATLMGVASRHASRREVAFEDAAAEVRHAAGGRPDLLGEAAGVFVAMGRADAAAWYANAAAHLCIAADGDPEVARGQVDAVAARLSAPRRGVAGGPPVPDQVGRPGGGAMSAVRVGSGTRAGAVSRT
ncbi:hypothetical protein BKD30_10570 [Tersicoccus phoenicis]|uniref:Uncharacterized protein n=1 Tax=Tersicoccus phoenicis TaxID=554083 RepID=A0A1R1L8F9_9MICC|nr:hypothetical protein [Tersicoccus phoenicis]OMH23815.1 hypothetical protein BKD30_10570 [Tersicoccus phoenicis]